MGFLEAFTVWLQVCHSRPPASQAEQGRRLHGRRTGPHGTKAQHKQSTIKDTTVFTFKVSKHYFEQCSQIGSVQLLKREVLTEAEVYVGVLFFLSKGQATCYVNNAIYFGKQQLQIRTQAWWAVFFEPLDPARVPVCIDVPLWLLFALGQKLTSRPNCGWLQLISAEVNALCICSGVFFFIFFLRNGHRQPKHPLLTTAHWACLKVEWDHKTSTTCRRHFSFAIMAWRRMSTNAAGHRMIVLQLSLKKNTGNITYSSSSSLIPFPFCLPCI